jgi:hypothetical protein
MTDPLFALVTAVSFLAALGVARWFKSLDGDLWRAWRTALPAGAVSGILLHMVGASSIAVGVILTLAALYVRLTGDESEPSDGTIFGAAAGTTAAVALIVLGHAAGTELAQFLLAGAVGGFGVTLASLLYVGDKLRQLVLDLITAAAAITTAALVPLVRSVLPGIDDRRTAIIAATAVPLIVIATVFKRWRDATAELSHEASLGFLNAADVRSTAHPFARLGRGGWSDRNAHRAFVRLATSLALRKRQQRNRTEDVARLYQLEIIKLRMQIQEMSHIDRAVAAAPHSAGEEGASDTMAAKGVRHE